MEGVSCFASWASRLESISRLGRDNATCYCAFRYSVHRRGPRQPLLRTLGSHGHSDRWAHGARSAEDRSGTGCDQSTAEVSSNAGSQLNTAASNSQQLFFDAIEHNDLAKVRELLHRGADLDKLAGRCNSTPLMWALDRAEMPVVVALLRARPNVNVRDERGETALHIAVKFKSRERARVDCGGAAQSGCRSECEGR